MSKDEKKIAIKLTADYWPTLEEKIDNEIEDEQERVFAGATLNVSIERAMDLVSGNKAVRADPMV